MANWNVPSLTDTYANFLAYFKARDDDAVRLNDSRATAATNVPDYSKRWNDTTKTFQNWLSAQWTSLVLAVAGGGTGATTAAGARTNLDVYSRAEADAAFATNLTNSSYYLAADVSLTTPGTYYDGPSVSLAAGTWLVTGQVLISKGTTSAILGASAVLYSGATAISRVTQDITAPAAASLVQIAFTLSGIITIGSTTTVKISAASTYSGATMEYFATSAYVSFIHAVKIA